MIPRLFLRRGRYFRQTAQSHALNCFRSESTNLKVEDMGKDIPPPKFLGSAAAAWKGEHTRRGTDAEMLWYQPYVVVASTAVFLIYFCVLREENDIDEQLYRPLYMAVPDLEKTDLLNYRRTLKPGDPNLAKVDQRLEELRKMEIAKKEAIAKEFQNDMPDKM